MKKTLSVLLVGLMLIGFAGFCAAAQNNLPVLQLNQPMDLQWDPNYQHGIFRGIYIAEFRFTPQETGLFRFDILADNAGNNVFYAVGVSNAQGNSIGRGAPPLLLDMSGQLIQCISLLMIGYNSPANAWLQAGRTYTIWAIAFVSEGRPLNTPQVLAQRIDHTAGSGNVYTQNVEVTVGNVVPMWELFSLSHVSQISYAILRIRVEGNAVSPTLVAQQPGTATLIIYDWAGNEVGRSTVTVIPRQGEPPTPSSLPAWLQFILRWFFFGWIWMR